MKTMLRLAARIRREVVDSQHTTDELIAMIALVVGVWFLVPGWAQARIPRVSAQMAVVAPVWAWGLLFVGKAGLDMFGLLAQRPGFIVAAHLIGCGTWLFLGGIMSFRHVPMQEGFVFLVIGLFDFRRLAQIPAE